MIDVRYVCPASRQHVASVETVVGVRWRRARWYGAATAGSIASLPLHRSGPGGFACSAYSRASFVVR